MKITCVEIGNNTIILFSTVSAGVVLQGLWGGMIAGLALQTLLLSIVLYRIDWYKEVRQLMVIGYFSSLNSITNLVRHFGPKSSLLTASTIVSFFRNTW